MNKHQQQGMATLLTVMVLLVVFGGFILGGMNIGNSQFKSVNNVRLQQDALAAAKFAIEQEIGASLFADGAVKSAQSIYVDLNNNNVNDFTVFVQSPICMMAEQIPPSGGAQDYPTDTPNSPAANAITQDFWMTSWRLQADVQDSETGTEMSVRHYIQVQLTKSEVDDYCS